MSCNCINEKKINFDYIEKLANAYSKSQEIDVKIIKYYQHGIGEVYDFEENWIKTGREVVKVIRFQQPESANILSNTGNIELASDNVGGNAGQTVSKSSKPRRTNTKPMV